MQFQNKNLIKEWVNQYGSSINDEQLEYYLEPWYDAKKEFLLNLFPLDSLRICLGEISITKDDAAISQSIDKDNLFQNLYSSMKNSLRLALESVDIPREEINEVVYHVFTLKAITTNRLEQSHSLSLKKDIKLNKGEKFFKALTKVIDSLPCDTTDLKRQEEELRQRHSFILNDKNIKGTLYISIHPMDYLTMSDNGYNWTTCLSWEKNGSYHAGTVSAMYSPNLVVAYIQGKESWRPTGTAEWSNKKWRELFYVSEDLISSIKPYPFVQTDVTEKVLNYLSGIVKTIYYFNGKTIEYSEIKSNKNIDFHSNLLYNDTEDYEGMAKTSQTYDPNSIYFLTYRDALCPDCGSIIIQPNLHRCTDCLGYVRCESCGQFLSPLGMIETVDGLVCQDCFEDLYEQCPCCEQFFDMTTSTPIRTKDDSDFICLNCYQDLRKYLDGNKVKKNFPEKLFKKIFF